MFGAFSRIRRHGYHEKQRFQGMRSQATLGGETYTRSLTFDALTLDRFGASKVTSDIVSNLTGAMDLIIDPLSTLTVTNTFAQSIENGRDNSMKIKLRLCAISILALFAVACTPTLVKMYNIHDQPIPHGLTQDQVRKAINIGAGAAGWSTEDVSPASIAATYKIRVHTVIVLVSYTEQAYSIDYKTSYEMKVSCTEEDEVEKRPKKVTSGGGACPGVDQPAYIHENYKEWIEQLNRGIRSALQNIN